MNTEPKWLIEIESYENHRVIECDDDSITVDVDFWNNEYVVYINGYQKLKCTIDDNDDDDNYICDVKVSSRDSCILYQVRCGDNLNPITTTMNLGEGTLDYANDMYCLIYRNFIINNYIMNKIDCDYDVLIYRATLNMNLRSDLIDYVVGEKCLNPINLVLPPIII